MLEVEHLSVSYGAVRALSDVSLGAEEGSITAVLGANGAGKTTLLRAITGLAGAKSGSVKWKGKELLGVPTEEIVRLGVAHVPEGRGVIDFELSVDENLRLGALFRRREPDHKPRDRTCLRSVFPALDSRRHRPAGVAVRRGASDARHRPGAGFQPAAATARRAIPRPGTARDARADAGRVRARTIGRSHPLARRAEHEQRPFDSRHGHRVEPRAGRHERRRGGARSSDPELRHSYLGF